MRRRRKRTKSKVGILFVTLILLLSSLVAIGGSYGFWYDELTVEGDITTTNWDACIKIRKTLDTDVCSEGLHLTIEVMNNGSNNLAYVEVTDSIGEKATPISGTINPSKGIVAWDTLEEGVINTLTWTFEDFAAQETETLEICLSISCEEEDYIPAEVTYPEDTNEECTHPIIRYTPITGVTETVYYVVVIDEVNTIKFEDCEDEYGNEYNLGEDGLVQTDTFVIRAIGGSVKVKTITKAGGGQSGEAESTLYGIGSSVVDDNGFTITLEDIVDIGGGEKEYTITVTSDDIPGGHGGTKALSHVEFNFGKYCPVEINEGATVTAESDVWGALEATTEGITIIIDEDGDIINPTLPYSTPWAWACADLCCNC
jgi:hypothetical protein